MKYLAIILCAISLTFAQGQSTQQQLATDIELKSTGSGQTINNCQSVTFIFRSSFTGTIGGIAFTATDVPMTVRAENGSVLRSIPYTVTAGTLVITQVH